jgi:hypothetical protein
MLAFVLGLLIAGGDDEVYPHPPARSVKGLQEGLRLVKGRLLASRVQQGMTEQEVKKVLGTHRVEQMIESVWGLGAEHIDAYIYLQYGLQVDFRETQLNGSLSEVPLVSRVRLYPHPLREWASELITGSKEGLSKR